MAGKKKKTKEPYCIAPMHIVADSELNSNCKLLLIYIYSFGAKGCWQSNETLAKIFCTTPKSISRWVSQIKKYLYIKCPKGYYRTFWAKSHPDVQENFKLLYRGKEIDKPTQNALPKNVHQRTQQPAGQYDKSAIRPGQKYPTTNKTTNTETIEKTIDPAVPMPAGGQAPPALEYRTQARVESLNQFMDNFGSTRKKRAEPLPEEEFQERVRNQRKALLASK